MTHDDATSELATATSREGYWAGLQRHVGQGWNDFWFSPSNPLDLCLVRCAAGLLAIIWLASFTPDLIRWYGPQGWLDAGLFRQWVLVDSPGGFSGRLSFLFTDQPWQLWTWHAASLVVLIAFTAGFYTRVTSVASFIVLLSYVHRSPFLGAAAEPVLTMLIGYLCLAPCGAFLSLDASRKPSAYRGPTAWTTIARRLLQVHLVIIYLVMLCTKFAGATWWNGEALWWLNVQPYGPSPSLTFLRDQPVVMNLWCYAILASEAAMVVLVWNRWLRPLVLGFSAISWLSIALVTGSFALPVTMLVANLVFVSSETVARRLNVRRERRANHGSVATPS